MRFGASVDRVQSQTLLAVHQRIQLDVHVRCPIPGGNRDFRSAASPTPRTTIPIRNFRELDFVFYAQDDWKVSPKLTVNLRSALRADDQSQRTNNLLYAVTNFATATGFYARSATPTRAQSFLEELRSARRFRLRSVRQSQDFHPRRIRYFSRRGVRRRVRDLLHQRRAVEPDQRKRPISTFPAPFAAVAGSRSDRYQRLRLATPTKTPYLIEYNLNVQHEFGAGHGLTVGYVGSHGVDNS